jgi:hypothetical protein
MTTRTARDRAFSDPEGERERRHARACEAVTTSLSGASIAIVAAELGISETDLRRMTKPSEGRFFAVADIPALPVVCATRLASWALEGHGLAVVELPTTSGPAADYATIAKAQRETSEVVSCGLDALAVGHIGRIKAAELERECDEAIAALLAVREIARAAKREGVMAIARSA